MNRWFGEALLSPNRGDEGGAMPPEKPRFRVELSSSSDRNAILVLQQLSKDDWEMLAGFGAEPPIALKYMFPRGKTRSNFSTLFLREKPDEDDDAVDETGDTMMAGGSEQRLGRTTMTVNFEYFRTLFEEFSTHMGIPESELRKKMSERVFAMTFRAVAEKWLRHFSRTRAPDTNWERQRLSEGRDGLSGLHGVHELGVRIEKPKDSIEVERQTIARIYLEYLSNQKLFRPELADQIDTAITLVSKRYGKPALSPKQHTHNWDRFPRFTEQDLNKKWQPGKTLPTEAKIRVIDPKKQTYSETSVLSFLGLQEQIEQTEVALSSWAVDPDDPHFFTVCELEEEDVLKEHHQDFASFDNVQKAVSWKRYRTGQGYRGIQVNIVKRDGKAVDILLQAAHTSFDGKETKALALAIAKDQGNSEKVFRPIFEKKRRGIPYSIETTPPLEDSDIDLRDTENQVSQQAAKLVWIGDTIIKTEVPTVLIPIKDPLRKDAVIDVHGINKLLTQTIQPETSKKSSAIDTILRRFEFKNGDVVVGHTNNGQPITLIDMTKAALEKYLYAQSLTSHHLARAAQSTSDDHFTLACVEAIPQAEVAKRGGFASRLATAPTGDTTPLVPFMRGMHEELDKYANPDKKPDRYTGDEIDTTNTLITFIKSLSKQYADYLKITAKSYYRHTIAAATMTAGVIPAISSAAGEDLKGQRGMLQVLGNFDTRFRNPIAFNKEQISSLARCEYGIHGFVSANTNQHPLETSTGACNNERAIRTTFRAADFIAAHNLFIQQAIESKTIDIFVRFMNEAVRKERGTPGNMTASMIDEKAAQGSDSFVKLLDDLTALSQSKDSTRKRLAETYLLSIREHHFKRMTAKATEKVQRELAIGLMPLFALQPELVDEDRLNLMLGKTA